MDNMFDLMSFVYAHMLGVFAVTGWLIAIGFRVFTPKFHEKHKFLILLILSGMVVLGVWSLQLWAEQTGLEK